MKKNYLKKLLWILIFPLVIASCIEDKDPPQPDFAASQSATSDVTITFTDLSSNNPTQWFWSFEGGTPSTSTERNPTVTYFSPGNYGVSLTATNSDGSKEIVKYDYVNIARFENPTWTDMDVTVGGITKTFAYDTYAQFAVLNTTNISFYAETYGSTSGGDAVGRTIFWEDNVNIGTYNTWYLDINEDFIYFSVTNNGPDNLSPFDVNVGHVDESSDDIVIPNGGGEYGTGYYYANFDMIVRAYFESDQNTYFEWMEGIGSSYEFQLPEEINQAMNLITGTSKGTSTSYKPKTRKTVKREGQSLKSTGSK